MILFPCQKFKSFKVSYYHFIQIAKSFYHQSKYPYLLIGGVLKTVVYFTFSDPRVVPHFYANPWGDNYYGDLYEYPVTSPPATRNNAYCACFDNLHGTVRRRSTKCKHCQKVSSSNSSKHNTSKNNNNSTESALKKLTKTVQAVQGGSGRELLSYSALRLRINKTLCIKQN